MQSRNRLLSALSANDLAALSPFLTEVQLLAGQVLYEPGSAVEAVYFPGGAVLSIITVMLDGRSVESATVGNESVVGAVTALTSSHAHARTIAQISGSVFKLPATQLRARVLQSPALLKILLLHVEENIAQLSNPPHAMHCIRWANGWRAGF
jgi:CRP-like cAMP-binding protein